MKSLLSVFAAIWAFFVIGWIANVVQVIGAAPAELTEATTWWLLKVVFIFLAPAGGVAGWIDMFS